MTNPITAEVWDGIRARHALVESAGQPTEAARAMAYLSHLDRRDLIAEIEALRQERHQLNNELTAAGLENERLRAAMRKALNVWDNYRITDTETEQAIKAECEALVGATVEPVSAPVEYVLEQRCKCGLIWRVHAEYSFRVNQIFCACGKKIYIDRDAVKSAPEPSDGYSQAYADQMRTALLRISLPVFINSKPAYADPDNVKTICDGLNERIKIAQDALLGLGKKSNAAPEPLRQDVISCRNCGTVFPESGNCPVCFPCKTFVGDGPTYSCLLCGRLGTEHEKRTNLPP